ncbi:MAG: tyrosine-type recombinase/integrase [Saprospiraceae bacterium]|nr:tyrosine-type recombinase/integrase [Saprospiraceae bacterium]
MFHEESFYGYLSLERRFSPHTLTAYRSDLSGFITFCTEQQCLTSLSEVRHLHIRSWIVAQMQAGQSSRSIVRRLSCLKTYFKFLKKRGLIEKDPMRKVTAPRSGKRLPVFVQESQMSAVFSHLEFADDYSGLLARLILEILYATGMRRSEASNLKINDIDFSRMVFRVRGKGDKERFIPFARYLTEWLEKFLEARKVNFPGTSEPWLFLNRKGEQYSPESIYYLVRKHLSTVTTAEQRSPHVLRHSFATHLSNNGADLNAIKELLGHSNLASTQVYMHNNIERLLQVYEQAHPKGGADEKDEDLSEDP